VRQHRTGRRWYGWLALLGIFSLSGCNRDFAADEVQIFAASSLTDAFRELGASFEEAHGIRPRLTFAGSQVLRLQIEQGAPADVYASADPGHMRALVGTGLAYEPVVFAGNRLALIVPADNPDSLRTLSDLVRTERLVVGSTGVPIGRYTRRLLEHADTVFGEGFGARVLQRVVSEETNVRLIRAKVQLGEASAAFVYESDVTNASGVVALPLPAEVGVEAVYQTSAMSSGGNPSGAELWVAWITSDAGAAVLRRHGFLLP